VLVIHPQGPGGWAEKGEDGIWNYVYWNMPNPDKECVFRLAVRLPLYAELITAEPQASEVRTRDGATTVIWRAVLPKLTREETKAGKPQVKRTLSYRLPNGAIPTVTSELQSPEAYPNRAPDLTFEIDDQPWVGAGERAYEFYVKARDLPSRYYDTWFKLGMILYDAGYYQESLDAFERLDVPGLKNLLYIRFGALVWQGHMLDLLDRRDEALERYRAALVLNSDPDLHIRHDQYGMVVNRRWVEERLVTPFRRHQPA
jgi:tetratricopeptide (TPR) repeat protein